MKGRAFGKAKVEVEEEAEPRLAPEPEPTTLEIPAPAPGQVMERSIKPAAPQPSATTTIAPELRRVRLDEQASMAQIMDILGPKGSFKIKLHRDYPEVWEHEAFRAGYARGQQYVAARAAHAPGGTVTRGASEPRP